MVIRGSPAKGVVRVTVARVQIPLSPPRATRLNLQVLNESFFMFCPFKNSIISSLLVISTSSFASGLVLYSKTIFFIINYHPMYKAIEEFVFLFITFVFFVRKVCNKLFNIFCIYWF